MERKLLSPEQIQSSIKEIPQWTLSGLKLNRKFKFKNFIEAFSFMTQVALICESYCHHPEWSNNYSVVEINLTTHDLGGISNLDFNLAKKINDI
ncbi:4a-hydroxytetrahydrobiopterin dehydratase [Prochlorococcus marinus]|uniref:4a-hydroxytetrahydrobiopterin dehydratase n=1 Tax=Prochlorococcus marinus TaxID=1219 RepID=UPI0022B5B0CD|nr:4a-hydroxytetrahydrobiopterin dehydratase [Prochlorococcus marinus]